MRHIFTILSDMHKILAPGEYGLGDERESYNEDDKLAWEMVGKLWDELYKKLVAINVILNGDPDMPKIPVRHSILEEDNRDPSTTTLWLSDSNSVDVNPYDLFVNMLENANVSEATIHEVTEIYNRIHEEGK